jgi:hypothetical protein
MIKERRSAFISLDEAIQGAIWATSLDYIKASRILENSVK